MCITENFLMTAEEIMAKKDWQDGHIFDLEFLLQPPAPELQEAIEEAQQAIAQPQPVESQAAETAIVGPDEMPDSVHADPEPDQCDKKRCSVFSVIHTEDWQEDLYRKISAESFDQACHHARACAGLSPTQRQQRLAQALPMPCLRLWGSSCVA